MSARMQINCLFLLISIFYYGHSLASPVFPGGCKVTEDFGWSGPELLLNGSGKQAIYLIRNQSNFMIELQRNELREVFMSPPLVAKLHPGNSAGFAADTPNLRFKCYKQEAGTATLIDCKSVLEICHYPFARFAASNMGTYWVSIDKPINAVVKEAVDKGIYLRWK